MRLLLVEDDTQLAKRLRLDLQAAGYVVDVADNGIDGQFLGEQEPYDGVILDLGLPGRSGLEVLRAWRERQLTLPVLILTARDAWHEKVEGFQAGADDYLGKPFHVEELLARVAALLRRASGRADARLSVNGITLDEQRQEAHLSDGTTVDLTGTEFRLLRYFMQHPDHILSKTELTDHVYAYDSEKDSNVIEVYVRRLRSKIGTDSIETRRGQGYCFPSRTA